MIRLFLVLELVGLIAGNGYLSYGPQYKPTIGKVWPKPYWQADTGRYYALDPNNFQFTLVNRNCAILEQAITRYTHIIKSSAQSYVRASAATPIVATIQHIQVNLTQPCQMYPSLNMDESYYVWGDGRVIANSIWGILRGLETFAQLLVPMPGGKLRVPETEIYDAPRFKYRGIMLDTARHFISKAKILELLEGMAYNKLNAFHWHMTDDSAFPYNSTVFPELSAAGAYTAAAHTYSQADVLEVVEFARLRGIRVIPEFDTPAHTASWGASHAELMTVCGDGQYAGQLGPFNPTLDTTYEFLYKFFSEIRTLFPDQYIHLGMDEVNPTCWQSNKQIQNYLNTHQLDNGDVPYMYLERFTANMTALGWRQMVWQEAIAEHNVMGWPAGLIGQIWFEYAATAAAFTQKGHQIIRSDGWYLYVLSTGSDWEKFYTIDPTNFNGTTKQKKLVLGGEACLWTEYINDNNLIETTFPRASAIAERLWSEQGITNVDDARLRLEEHNCRMLLRGISARPANSYGLC